MTYIPFVVVAAAVIALAVWLARRRGASASAGAAKLAALGFVPCPEDTEAVAGRIARMENSEKYRYEVRGLMRASVNGKPVYHYTKGRYRQGRHGVEMEELLVSLERRSGAGVLLFLKPTRLPTGTATRFIKSMAVGTWDVHPDDLVELDVPPDAGNVIGVLGPAGKSLDDLVDGHTLSALQPLGDCGIMIALCRDSSCSLTCPGGRIRLDLDKLMPVVRDLCGAGGRV